jgi:Ca-activated chloride channel family protein
MSSLIKLVAILALVATVGALQHAVPGFLPQATIHNINPSLSNQQPQSQPNAESEHLVSSYQDVQRGTLFFIADKAPEAQHNTPAYRLAPALQTEVNIEVSGIVARTTVSQTFQNNSEQWLSAVYAFPLPENAAVDHLSLKVGERVIEGQIKPKAQAKQSYQLAKAAGKKASLVEQQRPNLFTNSVANIAPGESIQVSLEYQQTLAYSGGQFSLRFPMTLSPRYRPPKELKLVFSEDGWAQDISNGTQQSKHQRPSPKDNKVSLRVKLDVGFELEDIVSEFHSMQRSSPADKVYQLTMDSPTAANQDFVLNWRPLPGKAPKAAHFNQHHQGQRYGLIMLMPPEQKRAAALLLPREVILVLDTSGSMAGQSIVQAKQALMLAIQQLNRQDRFNLIEFNSQARQLWPDEVMASDDNKQVALNFVQGLNADGGTEMADALHLALASPNDALISTQADKETSINALRQVVFITDGSVGNEASLMELIRQRLGDSRLFTVGIGAAPNSYFMREAAKMGKGTFTYIGSVQQVQSKMQTLLDKLSRPAMRDIILSSDEDMEFYPSVIPD